MEQKQLDQMYFKLFDDTLPVLKEVGKALFTYKKEILDETESVFKKILTRHLAFTEQLIEQKVRDEVEKQFLHLLPEIQSVGLAVANLIKVAKHRADTGVLISDKAVDEIANLLTVLEVQFGDARDYVVTRNFHLKEEVKHGLENTVRLANEFALTHQNRLITGACVPKASYLFLDIIDSCKRISRSLLEFIEKV